MAFFTLLGFCALWFVHTCDVDLAISMSDAISIENFPSFQITTAGNSDSI
jgi:hypothetical protein